LENGGRRVLLGHEGRPGLRAARRIGL
jgi:hypothetical protein